MEKQIQKWLEKGMITEQKALELLADYKVQREERRKIKIQIALYVIGAILVGLGVISFVAANDWIWQIFVMSDFIKILALSASTVGAFYCGYELIYGKKKYPLLGSALIFLSSFLIGGTYALIGQIYNLNADNSMLMFLWLVSILPLAYVFKARAINVLSIILFILGVIFYYMELSYDTGQTWTIYIPIMLGAFLYTLGNFPPIKKNYNDFSLSYKIVGLISIFITLMILTCSIETSYEMLSVNYIMPVMLLIGFNVLNIYLEKTKNDLFKLEHGYIIMILFLLLSILTMPVINPIWAQIIVHLFLVAMISEGFSYGYKFENVKLINLSTTFLIFYLITIYSKFGWTYFDKTLFFICGGIILFGLGFVLEKKKKEMLKGDK